MKRLVKENVFKELNKDTYYYLGLLATDGSIYENRVELSFKEGDEDILYRFRNYLKSESTVRKRVHNKKQGVYNAYRLAFRNQEIVDYLYTLGITSNKTYDLKLNLDFNFDLLRGIIDGDGCFITKTDKRCHRMTIITASIKFRLQIAEFLDKYNIYYSFENRYAKHFYLHIRQTESLLKLIEYLYNDTQTYMCRKFVTAQNIRNSIYRSRQIRGTSVRNPELSLNDND